MSEELKPCPFCGGDVSFHKDEECPGCHLVQCGQCRAFFDFATGADPGNDCESVDALRAAIAPMWNTRAQLAAIQGGMGEVVGFDRNAAYAACPESGCDWGSFYVGWKAAAAQHQRITAAMAAEVERLREALEAIQSRASNLMDDELFDMCDAALTQSPKGEEE